jgi:uncharacterized protein (TIGR02145 family)
MKTKHLTHILTLTALTVMSLLVIFSCKKDKDDDTPPVIPSCSIVTPSDSATVQLGFKLRIEAEVAGLGGDISVSFSIDTAQVSTTMEQPYDFLWDTEGWEPGPHRIVADAWNGITLLSDEITIIIIDTIIPLQSPVPVIKIIPNSGNTDTIFTFDASGSYDQEDLLEELLFRWDFDGDGDWDTEYTHQVSFPNKYAFPGTYNVKLEVMDTDGMTADTVKKLPVPPSPVPNACSGIVTVPYGGKIYHTVPVGGQCWLRENLNIGEMIPAGELQDNDGQIEKYCYDDDPLNCEKYGGLYRWKEMMNYIPFQGAKGICPPGWHIPSDAEWKVLEGFADSQYGTGDPEWDKTGYRGSDAGKHLKSLLGWDDGDNGDNVHNFRVYPAGYWESGIHFTVAGKQARFWSSTRDSGFNAFSRAFGAEEDRVSRKLHWEEATFSVRCIKD